MIRLLTIQELPLASQLGPQFYAEGKLPGKFVPECFVASWSKLLELGLGFILGLFVDSKLCGCFGATVIKDLSSEEKSASEMFWFVSSAMRGQGLPMLAEYEKEARKRGAVRCSMAYINSLHPEVLGKIYVKRGYRAFETAYLKELK